MIVVTFKQNEADFLLREFNIKVDSNLRFAFTEAKAAVIQEKCHDIEDYEYAGHDGETKLMRGDLACLVADAISDVKKAKRH